MEKLKYTIVEAVFFHRHTEVQRTCGASDHSALPSTGWLSVC